MPELLRPSGYSKAKSLSGDNISLEGVSHVTLNGGKKTVEGDPQGNGLMTYHPGGKPGILLPS